MRTTPASADEFWWRIYFSIVLQLMAVQPSGAAAECFGSVGTRAASIARASTATARLEALSMTNMLVAGKYVRPPRLKHVPRAPAPGAAPGAE